MHQVDLGAGVDGAFANAVDVLAQPEHAMRVGAVQIDSAQTPAERADCERALLAGEVRLIFASPERLARMRRVSPAKFIRQKLAMSQEAFAVAYAIPLDTLRAWERHEAEPGPVELAYLRAIERAPDATRIPEAV